VINNWNLDRGVREQSESHVIWKAVTTGNYGAIDLWLETTTGTLQFETAPVTGKASIGDLGIEPQVFEAGGLGRAIRLQRLPETMTQCRMSLRRWVKPRSEGDTRLYVRVHQEDGHRIWTSPIYLFR
jgi:hypothetical protein